ncbi:OB-fold domain-containing protein [Streptomyces gardneri]|uniref:Zn-ribbon domain-containing OB-fold protein n=1 Tax=Nocardia TaxID=1817 RepID=UPI001356EBD4|nr:MULTISPECIES: OB-fold domain-containing protein [Nocardia]MBF6167177.1 OB-fold domain-containing protein [Streptomyces gardneri]MBF6204221.1 OB-fold domain-containing protein [Streptomyces gardneri]UAK30579.1 OB-fold domain-containing protein [Nocardia asteroides]
MHTRNVGDAPAGGAATTLMIRRCGRCDRLLAPLFDACSYCRSADLEWVPASGGGSIVSWRVLRCSAHPRDETKRSTIAIVELDEGPWLYTTIHGELPPSSAAPVRVRFRACPRDDRFPVFAVSADPSTSDTAARPA